MSTTTGVFLAAVCMLLVGGGLMLAAPRRPMVDQLSPESDTHVRVWDDKAHGVRCYITTYQDAISCVQVEWPVGQR